jgi:3-phosphoshikimate 1-carboxyvinyltransferase
MSLAVASVICEKDVTIDGAESVNKSYPAFFEDFGKLNGKIERY